MVSASSASTELSLPGLLAPTPVSTSGSTTDDPAAFGALLQDCQSCDEDSGKPLAAADGQGVSVLAPSPLAPPPQRACQEGLQSMLQADAEGEPGEAIAIEGSADSTESDSARATDAPADGHGDEMACASLAAPVAEAAAERAVRTAGGAQAQSLAASEAARDAVPISTEATPRIQADAAAQEVMASVPGHAGAQPPAEGNRPDGTKPASERAARSLLPTFGRLVRELRMETRPTHEGARPAGDHGEGAEQSTDADAVASLPADTPAAVPPPATVPAASPIRHYATAGRPLGAAGEAEFRLLEQVATQASADVSAVAEEGSESPARIAGLEAGSATAEQQAGLLSSEKAMQAVVRQVVAPAMRRVGIDPAKVATTMDFVAPETSAPTTATGSASADASLASGATRTLQQVLQTADLMQAGDRSGLRLRLDFGESGPLSVQITLRQGRVHTLFRSDSPELRDSLSQAWSQFVQRTDGAGLPLAEPVLLPLRGANPANADAARWNGFSGQDFDGRSDRQTHEGREEAAGARFRGRRSAAAAGVPSAPLVPTAPLSSPGHLSALA